MLSSLRILLCLIVLFATWNKASAQGTLALNVGGAEAGPMIPSPAAVFWNPAALGGMTTRELLFNLETAWGKGSFERAPDSNSLFYPRVEANVFFPLPFLAYAGDFGLERWRFGFGLYAPFGSGGSWDPNGPQRFHLIEGFEASMFSSVSVAYQLGKKWWVGGSLSYVFSFLQGSVSLDLATTAQDLIAPSLGTIPTESPLFEAFASTGLLTGHNVGGNIGIFHQPNDAVDVGLSFQFPFNVTVKGDVEVTLPDVLALGEPGLAFLGLDGTTVQAKGQITQHRPGLIMLGAAYRPSARLQLEGVGIYALTSQRDSFKTELFNTTLPYLNAPSGTSLRNTGSSDSFQLKFGARYKLSKIYTTGGYLLYVQSGIPTSHVTASNIGFNLVVPSWYLNARHLEKNVFGFSLSPIIAIPRTVRDSVFDPTQLAGSGIGLPPGNGSYRGFGLLIGLLYRREF